METMNEERENGYKRGRRGILASVWQRGINLICLLAAVTAVTSHAQT